MPLYTSTGALNVAVNDTTGTGRYSASGALRINLVSGASYVGLYAADGAMNVVDVTGVSVSTYGGLYHPSGAIRGRTAPTTLSGLQAPDGSYYFNGLFSPLNLFSAGEQGIWYDPSDFSTMFQDNAGVTPVTAVEQTVGLILDKSKGLAVGTEQVSNGTFDSATGWTVSAQCSISSGTARIVSSDGTFQNIAQNKTLAAGWYKLTLNITSAVSGNISFAFTGGGINSGIGGTVGIKTLYFYIASSTSSSFSFARTAGVTDITIDNVSIVPVAGNHASQATLASRPTLSARVNQLLATATLSTQSVTTLAATYTLLFSGTGTVTASGTNVGVYSAGTNSLVCTAGALTLTVSGSVTSADLRVTNDGVGLPAYQAVTTSTNYDTTGFPLYLRFDGSNDSLATASINFSATDKMSVFAGVRKTSDAAQGVVAELTASVAANNGGFLLSAPNSAAANYNFSSKGTTQVDNTITTYTAPITNVITGQGNISSPANIVRLNGAQVGSVNTTQGTGNYANAALNIGRRGGATLPFNGRLYSLIVRGTQSTAAQIASTEAWINGKTKAY